MKRIYIIIILLCVLFSAGKAQKKPRVQIKEGITSLKIGDAIPDLKVKVFNESKKTVSISDYSDRLLILDFGNTGCSGCVAALPHMEALQKQFAGKVKLFWVTPQYEEEVHDFWIHSHYTKTNTLSTILEDAELRAYFKHQVWPHIAWINKGKVIAITAPDYVNAANIEKVLSGAQISWPVKDDFYVFDGRKQPLFTPDTNQVNAKGVFVKYAAISDYKPAAGKQSGIVRDSESKTVRVYFINQPIFDLFNANYLLSGLTASLNPNGLSSPNSVAWEVADQSKYKHDNKTGNRASWLVKNGICFESLNPDTGQTDQQIYKTVIADLNRLLGLNVRWEKRNEKVLVLVRTNHDIKIRSKQAIVSNQYDHTDLWYSEKGDLRQFHDVPLNAITAKMNGEEKNPYVFDETGYKNKVDLDLNISSWTDIAGIRKAIAPYGLALKEEERLVDKFVFTEINGGFLVDGQMQEAAKAKRAAQADMKNPTPEENRAFMETNKKKTGVITLPSGLQYKVIKQGTGAKPALNEKVRVNYMGTLVNGKIFDSSYETGRPAEIRLNKDRAIEGWVEALQLMPVGSKWMLYIPSKLAYGEHTGHGAVPANSDLVFELELLSIIN